MPIDKFRIKNAECRRSEQSFCTRNSRGFTLIELLVTIAIIAVLATVGLVIYSSAQKKARVSKRAQDLKALETAIELYYSSTNGYPTFSSWDCIGNSLAGLVPKYLPTMPTDPLDNGDPNGPNCYQYNSGGSIFEYKVRTNLSLFPNEMSSTAFTQQPTLIDPARDGTLDCDVQTVTEGAVYKGWAIYSGDIVCTY